MNPILIVRAIDVGYGHTKFTASSDLQVGIFPSIAARASPQSDNSSGVFSRRDTSLVTVDGHTYEVGPDTKLFEEVPVLHQNYIETPQYRALMYGALDRMQQPSIDLLVLGLPVHLVTQRRPHLISLFSGRHEIRPGKIVEVKEVVVIAQPMGGYFGHFSQKLEEWHERKEQATLLIDPGYFTIDWLVTREMKEVPGTTGGAECGVADYLRAVMEHINRKHGCAISDLRRIDEALRKDRPLVVNGNAIEVSQHRDAGRHVLERGVQSLRNVVRDLSLIDAVYLFGGGSVYFEPVIRQAFSGLPVLTVDDPIFANARGFHMLGEARLQRRRAA